MFGSNIEFRLANKKKERSLVGGMVERPPEGPDLSEENIVVFL